MKATDEATLVSQIIGLAEDWLGWRCVHFRPGRTQHGWATPVQGSMGKGWPDLIMVRDGRRIAAECKSAKGRVTPEQSDVLGALSLAGFETYVWRPADWDSIVATLGG